MLGGSPCFCIKIFSSAHPAAGDPPKRNFGVSSHKECSVMLGVERKCRKSLLKARAEIETSLSMGHPRDGSGKKYREKLPGNDDLFFAIENPASFHPKNNPVPSARTCM
jgi:hypothetical protein